MYGVTLNAPDDYDGWRAAVRGLLLAGVDPADVVWSVRGDNGETGDLFAHGHGSPPATGEAPALSVPRRFVDLAQCAILHDDPQRFALLHALLCRVRQRPAAMEDRASSLLARVEGLARSVRRDMHKMRAFVRFRAVDDGQGTRFVAWFEPDHHIVRANAGFFARRFATMRWSILTPRIAIHWDGERMDEGPGATRAEAGPDEDPVEALWRGYYAAIFNPARLKTGAMLSEMPRKYWRNLPEAAMIPALVAGAQAREAAMIATRPAAPRMPASPAAAWAALRREAMACTRCPLHRDATGTIFGQGPLDARIMFVGEQPGDREDRAGSPFVGPAGQLLDAALAQAGIGRDRAYVTNAVKHFKFQRQGNQRLHRSPSAGEIEACRWWLDRERAIVRPHILVALGASAARAILGRPVTIAQLRGRPVAMEDGSDLWITIHPSSILRLPDATRQAEERAGFVADLRRIGAALGENAERPQS